MVLGFDCNAGWLDINTSKTFMDVSASGTMAELTINGYHFDITGTTVNVLPNTSSNICVPSGVISASRQFPSEYEMGFSLKDVSSLEPTLLRSFPSTSVNLEVPGIVYAFSHVFFLVHSDASTNTYPAGILYRIDLIGGSTETIDLTSSNYDTLGGDSNLVVISRDIAYGLMQKDVGGGTYNLTLTKFDFCDSSTEDVYTLSDMYDFLSGGQNWVYQNDTIAMVKVEYNDEVYIVAHFDAEDSVDGHPRVFGFIYDVNADSTTEFGPENYYSTYDFSRLGDYDNPMQVYKDKAVWTANPYYFDTPPDPIPNICTFPTFIVDCTNKTVSVADSYTVDPSSVWPSAYQIWGNFIDYSTGEYYLWLEDFDISGNAECVKLDLDNISPTYSLVSSRSYQVMLFQGANFGCGVSYEATPYVVKFPGLTKLSSITLNNLAYNRAAYFPDEKNDRLWAFDDDTIRGYSMTSIESATTISVNWSGGTAFDYAYNKLARMYCLSGNIVVFVYSTLNSTFPYGSIQRDFYVLREDISCL